MCRLLAIKSEQPFSITNYLVQFSVLCSSSKEYQGHGWGCSYLDSSGSWQHHHSINPVWEDHLFDFGSTTLLLVHARSAFQDKDIVVENNMPFTQDNVVFMFNGELHGVRINIDGRIGAEKLFNTVRRFGVDNLHSSLEKSTSLIQRCSSYVRASNVIMSDGNSLFLSSVFNEDPDYFTLHKHVGEKTIICSEPFGNYMWQPVANGSIEVVQ